MSGYLDVPVKKNCYALGYSYGEICCHCGCCSDDAVIRAKARIQYHQDELQHFLNFNYWSDDPELRAVQEKNNKANIQYCRNQIRKYRRQLKRLEASDVGSD